MAFEAYEWCGGNGDCWMGWFNNQGFNSAVGIAGAAATFAVAVLAYSLSRRDSRERRVEAILRAKIAAVTLLPTITDLAAYAHEVDTCIYWIGPEARRSDEDAQEAFVRVSGLLQKMPRLFEIEQIAQLAPLENEISRQLAMATGLLAHLPQRGDVISKYVEARIAGDTRVAGLEFPGIRDSSSRASLMLEEARRKIAFIAHEAPREIWRPTDRPPYIPPSTLVSYVEDPATGELREAPFEPP